MESSPYHQRERWLSLAPGLHIEDSLEPRHIDFLEPSPDLIGSFRDDGYVQGSADWGLDLKLMAAAVRALSAAGLSPLFAFVYDEFWNPFFRLHRIHSAFLGDTYCLLPEFSVLNIEPGGAGWRPHRDRGRHTLFEDGAPKSLTTWISLTPATPLDGCIYVVPAQHDPTYGTAEESEMRFEFQSIRALPTRAGDFLIWNQALLHWGGKTSPQVSESRVSIALQFQRADLGHNEALDPLRSLPLEARVLLIARQLYRQRHLYDLDPKLAELAIGRPDGAL
ncbi:MAG TPA: phytanoyl-CoA dioxygenase family protein [Xanthobacteraceae bacterium]|nr:phytanoyl-CoA dioxygenase family protein [Xanthobacteraceae bacterium]